MDKQQFFERFSTLQQVKLLAAALQNEKAKIHVCGLSGSSSALVASALSQLPLPQYCGTASCLLFLLPGREEAAYFANDLENILGTENIFLFPSSLKKQFRADETDNSNVLLRAEVLSRFSRSKGRSLVVTYPEAIIEKVVTKKSLEKNTIEAHTGDTLGIDFVTEFLNGNEFDRSDFVYEPGQFSVRGGIVDIFSFAAELPYRLEFEGDMIISIRSFDPVTQLSEKNLHTITIIPNVQSKLVSHEHTLFTDYFPADTLLWAFDLQHSIDFIREYPKKLIRGTSDQPRNENHEMILASEKDITGSLQRFAVIETSPRPSSLPTGRQAKESVVNPHSRGFFIPDVTIEFNTTPQPSFNKNFDLLLNDLSAKQKAGYTTLILADTAKQVERLYSIIEDVKTRRSAELSYFRFSSLLLSIHEGFIDHDLKICCYTDHQVFERYHRYRMRKQFSRTQAMTLHELYKLKPGDYITHIDHGIGKFGGLQRIDVNGKPQEAIRLIYKDNDILYISIHSLHRITRYSSSEGKEPSLHKLGGTAWSTLKAKTKKRVKDIAKDLISLYAKRKAQKGFAFAPDTYMQTELEASFIYEDTPDQVKSTADVKQDMEKLMPMDRLICGDVGFGKTEIAIRAAFKAVADNKQVAVLVPTTILALQHYQTFTERLKQFPCSIDYINRFKSARQQKETIAKLKEGKIDIMIGTHRILSKDIQFKNLGLLVVDEEQKFGVASKEKIKSLRINVDTLTLTATPIPRTLQFSLMGARDLSIINTPPPNRYPVTTEVHTFNENIIREAITYEVSRGGQVFFVHNRIQNIHEIADMVVKLCPGVTVAVGHGQMDGEKLEKILRDFIEGDVDVLVSTTIIESGLDISNANTIIINQAQLYGLSDLHQVRGRVGRSNKKAFCYLLTPPFTLLTPEARRRLKAIEEFSDLGSGFNISMRDLDIRGAGNLLGGEQSGFINEIGFETYHKILDEAIHELKESDFKDLFPVDETKPPVSDCQVDTDLEILIPDSYVENITERLSLYKDIDDLENENGIVEFEKNLRDRFGPVPKQVLELFDTVRLRWRAKNLGFEKIILKNHSFKGFFAGETDSAFFQSEIFTRMIEYIRQHPQQCRIKDEKEKVSLTIFNIRSVHEAISILDLLVARPDTTLKSEVK